MAGQGNVHSSPIAQRLRASFRSLDQISDPSAWWADASILAELGPALANLYRDESPTIVVGIEARGFVIGPLAALALGVGFGEIRKNVHPDIARERLIRRTAPPDYLDRSITLTLRPNLLQPRDRVLLVDDWIETGASATAVRDIVLDAEASWIGVAVIVDALPSGTRHQLGVRSLVRSVSLPWHH